MTTGKWRKKLSMNTGGTSLTDTGGLDPGPSEVWQTEAIGGALQ